MIASIHFESPADDPLKVPRPLHLNIDPNTMATNQVGGEFGQGQLVGLSASTDPPTDFNDAEQWCDVGDIVADALDMYVDQQPRGLVPACEGWYPVVIDPTGMYTAYYRVKRIEVSV